VVGVEAGDEAGCRRHRRREAWEDAPLLVGVVVGRGGIEVLQDGARRRAGVLVAAVLGQVALQARQRGELPLDAAVTGGQQRQRIVERRGVIAKQRGAHRR
jgi:hypothetical protein